MALFWGLVLLLFSLLGVVFACLYNNQLWGITSLIVIITLHVAIYTIYQIRLITVTISVWYILFRLCSKLSCSCITIFVEYFQSRHLYTLLWSFSTWFPSCCMLLLIAVTASLFQFVPNLSQLVLLFTMYVEQECESLQSS